MTTRKYILSGIIFAVLVMAAALGLRYAAAHHIVSHDIPTRGLEMLMGLMIAFYGNEIPKKLPRFREGDSGLVQSLQRTIGWLLTIAGLGFALVWALVPLSVAAGWSIAVVGVAIALIAFCIVRTHLAQIRARSTG